MLHSFFPALSRVLTESPWDFTSNSPKWDASLHADNLLDRDPINDGEILSDNDSNDAITSYTGSTPSSPIQSFGNPSPTPAGTHPDNSQFSMLAQVGTPNIIRLAQSSVTNAPSIIRDAWLAVAPYSTAHSRSGSGPLSHQSSNPPILPLAPHRGVLPFQLLPQHLG